jgi:membrane protease YdiL (CAAX protease family)
MTTQDSKRCDGMTTLVVLTLLPLAVIAGQLAVGAKGVLGYSVYKIALLVPALVYCRVAGVGVFGDILKLSNWRNGLKWSVALGLLAIAIFWSVYYALGELLLDKQMITAKIDRQFSVNATSVLLVAPITIVLNSLLEEFFYRGFAFGLLVRRCTVLGFVLPAVAFTVQHLLFIYHWLTPLPFAIAVVGLLVFAFVLEKVYAATDTIVAPWLIHIFGDIAMMGIAVTLIFWGK